MSVIFEEVALTVTKRINAKFGSLGDKDDALQEALIRAWKDVEDGSYDYNHIVNRAVNWARKYLFPGANAQKATGSTRSTAQGFVRNTATREKIKMYREEYIQIHDKIPSQRQISAALGISQTQVSYYMKDTRVNVKVIKSKDGSRIDHGAYRLTPLVDARDESDGEYNSRTSVPSFEASVMNELAFQELISPYDIETQRALTLHFKWDWTFMDIGKLLWPEVSSDVGARSRAQRLINKAKATIAEGL